MTPYHSQYFAYELTRRFAADDMRKLAATFAGAQVDLNPHQVDAALFAFHSPLSKGALLADEVGLGKTIEAGLVVSQKWAERKRRILIITPSNLRKQWHQEMNEKFFLPCKILESRSFNQEIKAGNERPFEDASAVIICSFQFARSKAEEVRAVPWDIVVIDEAHRLRNVYKTSNIIANALRNALSGVPKILLTATPLQNSLLELYGLISFIDERAFGDLQSFREQFSNLSQDHTFSSLKNRLQPFCHRTLRRQVLEYVPYTKRIAIVEEFAPADDEDALYHLVTEYLQRENLQALPTGQRSLMTLVLRKLLASSTFAIAGALTTMSRRLKTKLEESTPSLTLADELDKDYEALDETAEEWPEGESGERLSAPDREAIEREIADLDEFVRLAVSIEHNAKGRALLIALKTAFAHAKKLGAAQKAIIFTESRRSQDYLLRVLSDSEFAEGIVLFNGSNTDERSKQIYAEWIARHAGTDRATGSRTADMRSALVEYFRDEGRIMIATEAGAEGINLQFCSLVVNYDLPWNPQRVEQRIGRCHRYGQKHDVVVVNFLNKNNEADQRVYQLLDEKFQLFEGVFGASDEVLGAVESGVDFEKRIAAIYQQCRKPAEIKREFDQLQLELSFEINEAMTRTRRQLLEHFDDEVTEKLRISEENSKAILGRFERRLMQLSQYELNGHAVFHGEAGFELLSFPFEENSAENDGAIPLGLYELPRRSGEAHFYRLGHPLAERLVERSKARDLPTAEITFNLSDHDGNVSTLRPFVGQSGWLQVAQFSIESLGQMEDHLCCAALCDNGSALEEEVACRLFNLPAQVGQNVPVPPPVSAALEAMQQKRIGEIMEQVSTRNLQFFESEVEKLDGWAEDLKVGLEREIKDYDRQIKEARRGATAALSLQEKLAGQKMVRALETQRSQKRRALFDAQDDVDKRREELITDVEGKLQPNSTLQKLFIFRWSLI